MGWSLVVANLILLAILVAAAVDRKDWHRRALDYKKKYDCAVIEIQDVRSSKESYTRMLEARILDLQRALEVREKLHDALCSRISLAVQVLKGEVQ